MCINVENLGINIQFLRKKRKLKQDEMPDLLGVGRSTWSNYENGLTEPDLKTLMNISKFFGVSIDDLLSKNLYAESLKGNLNEKEEDLKTDENSNLNGNANGNLNEQKTQNSDDIQSKKLDLYSSWNDIIEAINKLNGFGKTLSVKPANKRKQG